MYVINGAMASPYSMKMRALFRYRRIAHIWNHGAAAQAAQSEVKAPVIPVIQYPDGSFHNDSTPVASKMARLRSLRPSGRRSPLLVAISTTVPRFVIFLPVALGSNHGTYSAEVAPLGGAATDPNVAPLRKE